MTRDQAYIHACDEVNKTRPLTEAEVDRLCEAIEREREAEALAAQREAARAARAAKKAADPAYARHLERLRKYYRNNPEVRARRIEAAKARYWARKGA